MVHVDDVQTEEVVVDDVLQQAQYGPARSVDQRDEAQQVEGVVAVVPRARVYLPKN